LRGGGLLASIESRTETATVTTTQQFRTGIQTFRETKKQVSTVGTSVEQRDYKGTTPQLTKHGQHQRATIADPLHFFTNWRYRKQGRYLLPRRFGKNTTTTTTTTRLSSGSCVKHTSSIRRCRFSSTLRRCQKNGLYRQDSAQEQGMNG